MKRITPVFVTLALALTVWSCGGSSTLDNTEAAVFLTVEVTEYNPEIDLCLQQSDMTISSMEVTSEPKNPTADLGANQDVNLERWVIRPYRTDGGSTTSPEWTYDNQVYVPAGGNASLENYRIYPLEYLGQVPLAYLLPENGGFDPETGNSNIRQSFELQIFGETVSGKSVATVPISISFNFYCLGQ
ncbi:hypothetical protein ACFLQM_00525 [Acidobacteriota bacterium]